MKIYLDIFFIVNMEIDLLVLLLECQFQRRQVRWRRLIVSALTGGIFSTLFLVSGIHRHRWLAWPVYFVGCGGMILIAFGRTTVRAWLKNLLMFCVSACLLAGMLMRIQSIWNRQGSMVLLLSVSIAAVVMANRLMPAWKNECERQAQILQICLCYKERYLRGNGLLDTGNRLTEPFSGKPVSIASRLFLQAFFDKEEPLMRYIPFHAVGTKSGIIAAFQADYIEIRTGENKWVRIEKPWIAISDDRVSADGEFDLILPAQIVKNSE